MCGWASRPRTKNGPTSVSLNYSQPPRQSDSSPPNHLSVRSSCGRSSYPTRVSARPHGTTSVAENAEVAGILRGAVHEHLDDSRAFLDWIIVGGDSGPHARPMNPAWARSLRDQAANTGVAFLFKQWGEWAPLTGVRYSDFHHFGVEPADCVRKVGKKSAGRELDGRIWDEFPDRELP